jgi:phosphatidylglycerol---prolipoprotein diacylglyceryl transferase
MKRYYHFSKNEHLESLLYYIFVGVILGWRLGYILLYDLSFFMEHPIQMIKIWEGGMSFHGWLLGTILAMFLFAKRYQYPFWWLIDTLAVIIPVALGLGRIGNWINMELPGYAPYDGILPMMISGVPHFPAPLLEMLLEGMVLFGVMLYFWSIQKRWISRLSSGILSGIFLVWYSIARIIAEQYRLPDIHIGYLLGTDWMTLGMIYTLPMMGVGVYLVLRKLYQH